MSEPLPVASLTPAQAAQEMAAMRADTSGPYWNAGPAHDAAVERYQALVDRAAPPPPSSPAPPPGAPPRTVPTVTGDRPVRSVEEIRAEIGSMLLDKNHPINDRDHPGHDHALQEHLRLSTELLEAKRRPAPDPAGPAPLPFALPAKPDGRPWSAAETQFVRDALPALQGLGLQDQAVKAMVDHCVERLTKEDVDPDASLATLKQHWGEGKAFDEHLAAAQRALMRFPAHIRRLVETTSLGNDAHLLRRLAEMGKPMVEAQRKRAAMLDQNHPLMHPERGAEHEAALQEYHTLGRVVYGPGYNPPAHGRR